LEVLEFSISFDRVAEVYDKTRSLPDNVMKELVKELCAELENCTRILDVGVGTGRLAKPLQNAGFEVVGIDISKKMISKAREKSVQNLVIADARFIPFKDKSFDAAISVHLLHLISEWKKALREVCRVTRHAMFSLYDARKDIVRETYYRIMKQHGHERHHPGKSEQDLKDSIIPTKSTFVISYDVSANSRLNNLQLGTSSSQWQIPKQLNSKVVEQLKKEFAGKVFKQDLYLQSWEIDSLKAFAKEENTNDPAIINSSEKLPKDRGSCHTGTQVYLAARHLEYQDSADEEEDDSQNDGRHPVVDLRFRVFIGFNTDHHHDEKE
jgi:ubiquinone/menaquinone biosynthesis C-methylase UbiE